MLHAVSTPEDKFLQETLKQVNWATLPDCKFGAISSEDRTLEYQKTTHQTHSNDKKSNAFNGQMGKAFLLFLFFLSILYQGNKWLKSQKSILFSLPDFRQSSGEERGLSFIKVTALGYVEQLFDSYCLTQAPTIKVCQT